MSKSRNASMAFIFITILLEAMGVGLIIPVLPKLVAQFTAGTGGEDASRMYGYLIALYALMIFLFSPLLGALSDRYGRRPVLLVSLLGQGLDYLLLAVAPDLWWFAVGRIIAGICGASFTTAQAYVADVSTAENRAASFGLVSAAFGVGFILGPALGGLLGQLGLRAPFYAAAALALVNTLYGLLVLPESLAKDKRRPIDLRECNPLGAFLKLSRFPAILGLVAVFALINLSGQVMPSTWVLFTEKRFQWSELDNGLSLACIGLLIGLVQGLLTRKIIARFGERNALLWGLLLMLLTLVANALVPYGWLLIAFMAPYALGGVATPALQAMMTTRVDEREQGLLQGALTGVLSIAAFVGPLMYTQTFAWFTAGNGRPVVPGAAFLLAAVVMLGALVLGARVVGRGFTSVQQTK